MKVQAVLNQAGVAQDQQSVGCDPCSSIDTRAVISLLWMGYSENILSKIQQRICQKFYRIGSAWKGMYGAEGFRRTGLRILLDYVILAKWVDQLVVIMPTKNAIFQFTSDKIDDIFEKLDLGACDFKVAE